MKNILVLIGSTQPHDKSVSTRALHAFIKVYQQKHPEDTFQTIDLSEIQDIAFTRTLLSGNLTAEDHQIVTNRKQLLDAFKKADSIVLSSPMWNFGLPGKVKECLDTFVVAGETFKYLDQPDASGAVSKGLTVNKKLIYMEAMGGNNAGSNDIAYAQVKQLFTFIGVTDITYFPIQATNIPGMSEEETVTKKIEAFATTF